MTDQQIIQLEAEVESLFTGQDRILKEMHDMFMAMNAGFDQLVANCSHDREDGSVNRNGRNGDRNSGRPSHTFASKLAKIDFPRFNGNKDPTSRVHRA